MICGDKNKIYVQKEDSELALACGNTFKKDMRVYNLK